MRSLFGVEESNQILFKN